MKYRHAFHAGNFADVHKHVTLLALLGALARKDKGFLFVDTHAGRGCYDLASADARKGEEFRGGVERLLGVGGSDARALPEELQDYAHLVRALRNQPRARHACPGSPWLALQRLRAQDRAVLIETQQSEHVALREAMRDAVRNSAVTANHLVLECADGYARLKHWLPNVERRALVLIDPPYEDTRGDFSAAANATAEILKRLPTAVIAIWYPIKDGRDTDQWLASLPSRLPQDAAHPPQFLQSEVWIHPRDTRVGLNGSGIVIVNPPWQIAERMQHWLPALHALLDPAPARGGWRVR
ncbi:MAG: 23S rRNA (adenine(2030)-N(6))-methyltransferase RlmJ [Steroidobacteraceae bacterium]|jgi:23S rRNA (adenine2030-N6)-methyltransferase